MAIEVYDFDCLVPTGTTAAAPQVVTFQMPVRRVDRVQITVPPGPRGEVGFQFIAAGRQMIPHNPGQWLVTDDEALDWPLEGQPSADAWAFQGYNTGDFPHTIHVTFLCSLLPAPPPETLPLDPSLLSSGGFPAGE